MGRMRDRKGFTLIELVVVVLIVGILAGVAIPLMRGRIDSSKWSEAKAAMGSIATALRVCASEKGTVNQGDVCTTCFSQIGFDPTDLDGTYFGHECYTITAFVATNGVLNATIYCDATKSTKASPPSSPADMTLTITNGAASFNATTQ